MSSIEASNRTDFIQSNINDVFSEVPKIIYSNIPSIYHQDKTIKKNIYKSVLLSLLSSYTLPQEDQLKLQEKLSTKTSFDETSFNESSCLKYARHSHASA